MGDNFCAKFLYGKILGVKTADGEGNCNYLAARLMMRNDELVGRAGAINPIDLIRIPEDQLPKTPDGRLMIALMHGNKDHDYHIGLLTDIITVTEGGRQVKLFCELHEQFGVEYSIFSPEGIPCPEFRAKIEQMQQLDKQERAGKVEKGTTETYVKANFPPAFMNIFRHRRQFLHLLQFKTGPAMFGTRTKENPNGHINLAINIYWPKAHLLTKISPAIASR